MEGIIYARVRDYKFAAPNAVYIRQIALTHVCRADWASIHRRPPVAIAARDRRRKRDLRAENIVWVQRRLQLFG